MKKYFYDCPIKALYMHLNFNVKCSTEIELIADLGDENSSKNMTPEITKILVTDESNHIFKPQVGDICYSKYFDDFVKITNESFDMHLEQIIMRDGKHFFMPKLLTTK